MRELTFDEFRVAWSTYWGRREIGFVVENRFAPRVAASTESLSLYFDQWKAALAVFPEDASFWLMGTPDLTPELRASPGPDSARDSVGMPPPPRIGRFAEPGTGTSTSGTASATAFSELAGDYEAVIPPKSDAAKTARTLMRAVPGTTLSFLSLLVSWFPPVAIPMAVLGLAWTVPAHRILRGGDVPWRYRRKFVIAQSLAALTLVLSAIFILTSHSLIPSIPREDVTVTHTVEGSLSGDIVTRLWTHWPDADIGMELVNGDPNQPSFIRVRVSDRVYLDAIPGAGTWQIRPMTDATGVIAAAPDSRPYTIGVTTDEGADAIADRFYEEVRFWWQKLHAELSDGEQSA